MRTLRIVKYSLVIIQLFLLLSCGSSFDKEHPYSVQVSRFRYGNEAKDQLEKLKNKGLNAFLYTSMSEEGKWHHLLIGVDDILERTMEKKIEYEDKYGLKKLTIINYNSMVEFVPFFESKDSYSYDKELFLNKVELNLLKYAIYPEGYLIDRFTLLPKKGLSKYFDSELIRKTPMDLPRGIAHHYLFKKVSFGMEFVFHDPITGREVIAQLFKLNEGASYQEVRGVLTQKIFNTRVYQKEEIIPWGIDGNDISGDLVNIKPSNNKVIRYGIAGNEQERILLIVQSSDNNIKFWEYLLKSVGASSSLIEEPIYYNLLSSVKHPKDDCLKVVLKRNSRRKSKYDKLVYGYYNSDVLWEDNKQFWTSDMVVFNDSTETNSYFKAVLERQKYNRYKVDTLLSDSLSKVDTYLVTTLRKNLKNNGRREYFPYKVLTKQDNLFLEVSNTKRSFLSGEELEKRVNYFKEDDTKKESILDRIF